MPSSEVFDKFKHHQLRSGGTGPVVRNRKQAIAIYEREKRKEDANGGVYPERTRRPKPRHSSGMAARTR